MTYILSNHIINYWVHANLQQRFLFLLQFDFSPTFLFDRKRNLGSDKMRTSKAKWQFIKWEKNITGTPMATCKTLINNTRSRGHLCRIVMGLIISVTSYNDWWVGDLWSFLTKVRASATVSLCVSISIVIEKKYKRQFTKSCYIHTNFLKAIFVLIKFNIWKYNRGHL